MKQKVILDTSELQDVLPELEAKESALSQELGGYYWQLEALQKSQGLYIAVAKVIVLEVFSDKPTNVVIHVNFFLSIHPHLSADAKGGCGSLRFAIICVYLRL